METLELLVDNQIVRINVPLIGRRTLSLDCVPQSIDHPTLDVGFLPGQLPVEEIDFSGQCTLSFDVGDMVYVVRANIDGIPGPGKLRLINVQSYTSTQKREFFRIDTELSLYWQPLDEDRSHSAPNARVNLSGGGIRFPTDKRLSIRDEVAVKLCFDDQTTIDAECVGRVVRVDEKRNGQIEVAVAFTDIDPKDRDRIVSFCFARQREQLRQRVQVRSDFKSE
ncbi:MAG: hypothetical protein D6751_08945 [Deltaproteobacteria bacterium]|nr:MAG: hypothetical protein D6751_08945 [Deltaproteobacteria bacterium]